jgi:hypothetical protein
MEKGGSGTGVGLSAMGVNSAFSAYTTVATMTTELYTSVLQYTEFPPREYWSEVTYAKST